MHLVKRLLYELMTSLRVFQKEGLRAGLVKLGRIVLRIFSQRAEFIVIARTLSDQVPLQKPKPGLTIRQVTTREELASLSSIADLSDMTRFRKMFDKGSIAFIALQNDQVVGYCWASQEIDRSVNRVQPPLRPGDSCAHDLFVSPALRGQGIGRTLVSHRLRFLREHGHKRTIGAILKGNTPVFKVIKKVGYIHIGEMSHTRILFWDLLNYNPFGAQKESCDV